MADLPKIGDVLASKYRVERVLGSGAMGIVVAARHEQLGSLVALKFMHGDAFKVKGSAARFVREARAAARLRSEHVARVGDFGTLESGAPYIVMEFLEGADLDAVLKQRGPLPIGEVAAYMMDVCKAMDEAHAADIVHRDIKPKNLFLTHRHDGTPLIKVLDFGISKLLDRGGDDADVTATDTGSILGSPAFMSPEQIRSSKHVDARADIYAIGATIFQLATNAYPYESSSVGELFAAVLYKPHRSLRELRPDAPEALEALVARCLKKEPSQRYATARALMAALAPLAEGAQVHSTGDRPARGGGEKPLVDSDAGIDSTLLATQATSTRRDSRERRSSSTGTIATCLALIAVVALGAGILLQKRRHASMPPSEVATAEVERPDAASPPASMAPPQVSLEAPSASSAPPPKGPTKIPPKSPRAKPAKPTASSAPSATPDVFGTPE
ncbi:serine/threonine protein kinase [Pendulispora brunnea]|uniref:Serine/threonine protein kinase n=1 Tax=Pendulispora brunnea TaxID=2905690 RepID=A0ABZ2K2I6_9BACT